MYTPPVKMIGPNSPPPKTIIAEPAPLMLSAAFKVAHGVKNAQPVPVLESLPFFVST